ncbi:MAG: hypothetical protein NTX16_14460 [Actinobacteria bacterium]|nr:hypothetical protein [Actinomycetota bacterium]
MTNKAAGHGHSTQHLTDVRTRRVFASSGHGCAAIGWDYPGSTLLEVRILRSEHGFVSAGCAPEAGGGAAAAAGQTVVYSGVTGSFRDAGLQNGCLYYYTVFARHQGGEWLRWGEYELRPGVQATSVAGRLPAAFLRLFRRALPAATALLLCLAALAAAPGSALAAAPDVEQALAAEAVSAATADPVVAAVLEGTAYMTDVTPWSSVQGAPAGATVTFTWPAASARSATGLWPLLESDDGEPVPPYDTVEHHVRITDLTALQVDVLLRGGGVVQMLPLDGETQFQLREETWSPFSRFPWFTARPWVLLPLFLVVGALVIARAWRRSRSWNRRLPSMTRHDRQFLGRLAVMLFLLAGFVWQVYEAIYAAGAPAMDPGGLNAGDLAALPMLLFPPAVFLAALAMELTPSGHRVAWGLVSFLAAAGSIYNLAAAMTGTTTNLNLSYYILLGVLCILSAPRAFSAGRMGWSRNSMPRYS